MQKLNLKVKFRESFRPVSAVLLEDLNEWFELDSESPYMLLVGKVEKITDIQNNNSKAKGIEKQYDKITNTSSNTWDNSARIQTVTSENGIYYELIKKFKEKTGCPIIVNTSFNVRGEPPVNNPIDAYKCFMATDMDLLVLGNHVLEKNKQIKFWIMMDNFFKKKLVFEDDVLKSKIEDKVVNKVINFYNEAPFPNYENNDDKSTIVFKGDNNYLAKEFKKYIGFNKDVLEVGCGTGQLSLYFAIGNNNRIFALDQLFLLSS